MLFGFYLVDEGKNWFHEFIVSSLSNIHQNALEGGAALTWPHYVDRRYRTNAELTRKPNIKKWLDEYEKLICSLNRGEKKQLCMAALRQNLLANLLSCQCNCQELSSLPAKCQKTIEGMFEYFFGVLTPIGMRDAHYQKIHSLLPQSICPFCGYNRLSVPGSARPDYDHYLPKSKYPYAAANLDNLVPICSTCNSRYKGEKDPLKDIGKKRRKAFYPYTEIKVTLSLSGGEVLPQNGQEPNWEIVFSPESDEVETWKELFEITSRYKKDIFLDSYQDWLEQFKSYAAELSEFGVGPNEIMTRYLRNLGKLGFKDDGFFKLAYFESLFSRYHAGQNRYVRLVQSFCQADAA